MDLVYSYEDDFILIQVNLAISTLVAYQPPIHPHPTTAIPP